MSLQSATVLLLSFSLFTTYTPFSLRPRIAVYFYGFYYIKYKVPSRDMHMAQFKVPVV